MDSGSEAQQQVPVSDDAEPVPSVPASSSQSQEGTSLVTGKLTETYGFVPSIGYVNSAGGQHAANLESLESKHSAFSTAHSEDKAMVLPRISNLGSSGFNAASGEDTNTASSNNTSSNVDLLSNPSPLISANAKFNAKLMYHMAGPSILANRNLGANPSNAAPPAPRPGTSTTVSPATTSKHIDKTKKEVPTNNASSMQRQTKPIQTSGHSWQCFHSLLFVGNPKTIPDVTASVQATVCIIMIHLPENTKKFNRILDHSLDLLTLLLF
jgi:hypothetical protein